MIDCSWWSIWVTLFNTSLPFQRHWSRFLCEKSNQRLSTKTTTCFIEAMRQTGCTSFIMEQLKWCYLGCQSKIPKSTKSITKCSVKLPLSEMKPGQQISEHSLICNCSQLIKKTTHMLSKSRRWIKEKRMKHSLRASNCSKDSLYTVEWTCSTKRYVNQMRVCITREIRVKLFILWNEGFCIWNQQLISQCLTSTQQEHEIGNV